MDAAQTATDPNPAEAIWAILRENARQLKEFRETQQETEKRMQE